MTTANTQPRVAEVREILSEVMDPEYGTLSIVDLGIVADVVIERDAVGVTLLPTMAGCPAREVIELDVRSALLSAGASNVSVKWCLDGSWEPHRLSAKAIEQLGKEFSIAIRNNGALPSCPICDATSLREVSPVGPTRCRSVAWCDECRNVVEVVG